MSEFVYTERLHIASHIYISLGSIPIVIISMIRVYIDELKISQKVLNNSDGAQCNERFVGATVAACVS